MGFIQLLASLWPFFKEMFIGEKIQDPHSSKRGDNSNSQDVKERLPILAARWCIEKMRNSRKFHATIITLLIISVFLNYKLVTKVAVLRPQDQEQHAQTKTAANKEQKETPTIPRKDSSEKDIMLEQTVRELKNLYGESR